MSAAGGPGAAGGGPVLLVADSTPNHTSAGPASPTTKRAAFSASASKPQARHSAYPTAGFSTGSRSTTVSVISGVSLIIRSVVDLTDPTRQPSLRSARDQSERPKRSADSVGGPSRKIEASEATGSPREALLQRVAAVPRPRSDHPCRPR